MKHVDDCRTCGGKISRFGTIHILDGLEPKPDDTPDTGREIWGPMLYAHRKGNFRAIVEGNHLAILDEAGKMVAATFAEDLFSVIIKYWGEVMENGWVLSDDRYLQALLRAEKGERPSQLDLDESRFVKVDKKLVGSRVFCLTDTAFFLMIFNEDEQIIDYQSSYPLSYKKLFPRGTRA